MRRAATGAGAWMLIPALLLAGCTASSQADAAASEAESTPSGSAPAGVVRTPALEPSELSSQILDEAARSADAVPLQTFSSLGASGVDLAGGVLEVRRISDGTLVSLTLSGPVLREDLPGTVLGPSDVLGAVTIVVSDSGETRYTAVEFVDDTRSCLCPALPLGLSSTPLVVEVLFPALPAGTSRVDVQLGDSSVATDVPISR